MTKDQEFSIALTFTLKEEGGKVDHPADPGGRTAYGITQKVYDEYNSNKHKDVFNITESEIYDIYKNNYWLTAKCDKLPYILNVAHFDAAVNTGIKQANKFLQRAIGVKDDGIIGPITLNKINAALDIKEITSNIIDQRQKFYNELVKNKPSLKVFIKGWTNRINKLKKYITTI